MSDNKPITLNRIKRKLWAHRLFNRPIPSKYDEAVIQLTCCDNAFMRKYALTHKLSKPAENLLMDLYMADCPDLIADYISRYKIEHENQVKVVQSRNLQLIKKLAAAVKKFNDHNWDLFRAIIDLGDVQLVLDAVNAFEYPIWDALFTYVLERQDAEMFKMLIGLSETYSTDSYYHGKNKFDDTRQEQLLQTNNQALLDIFFEHHHFCDRVVHLLLEGSIQTTFDAEKLTARNIELSPLHDSVLCLLVSQDRHALLKQYEKKYGLPKNVLAYYADLHLFRKSVGYPD